MHKWYLALGFIEFGLLIAAVYIGIGFILGMPTNSGGEQHDLFTRALVFAGVMSCCTVSMGVYLSYVKEGFSSMALRTLVSFCLLGGGVLTILYYVFPGFYLGRGALFWSVMAGFGLVLVVRWVFFKVIDAGNLSRRIILLGAGRRAKEIVDTIQREESGFDLEVYKCFAAEGDDIKVDPSLIQPVPDNWRDYTREHQISEVVVAPDERRRSHGGGFPLEALLDCKLDGVVVNDVLSFCERELSKVEVDLLHPGWMLFSDGFRYSRSRDFVKRAFDITVSIILLVILWPLMLLTALAVYLETGRPLIYSQERVGLNSKPFRIYKFRSMRQDAEKDGAVWAQKNDSRVTRVGAFIRNTRLDELPQLYNVIRGDMSFVGPRPERPEFVKELSEKIPFYDTRHRVKPGLMGWAQLKYPYGASQEDAKGKLRYDLYYMKNHSFLMDLLIMIQTVEVVLLGKGVR